MQPIKPNNSSTFNMPKLSLETAVRTGDAARPVASPNSPDGPRVRPSPTGVSYFIDKGSLDVPHTALRASTEVNVPTISSLRPPVEASRAHSAGSLGKVLGPNPAATFADLRAAWPTPSVDPSHVYTAIALAKVIQGGQEGLKTVFGYDDNAHIAFGSHDELEMNKKNSTQHTNLLSRVAMSMKSNAALDPDVRRFGGGLLAAGMRIKPADNAKVKVGGTRLMQQDDGSLKFTQSEALGFKNVTEEVLKPVAEFHANVLRLAGLGDRVIKGDGDTLDALAERVSHLLRDQK